MQHQQSVFTGIDSLTPLKEPLSGKYLKSFAYYTMKERLPVILTSIVDILVRNKDELTYCKDDHRVNSREERVKIKETDLKSCIGKLSKLKNELQTNKRLTELTSKGEDVQRWNAYLAELTKDTAGASWFESPWLYSECYLYRRIQGIFEESLSFQNLDYFAYQKEEAMEKNIESMKFIGSYLIRANGEREMEYFLALIKTALWSNRCDLSLSAGKSSSHELNIDYIRSLDKFLLHDDSVAFYKLMKESRSCSETIDYITDNAGFELFCDLCFCDFLCSFSFVKKVRFHVKQIPWYVSDATANDIKYLLNRLPHMGLDELSFRWERYFSNATWTVHDESYWTMPYNYVEMVERDKHLYNSLSEADFIIFKGDLNYRKLLQDINWKSSEKFDAVLGKFRPATVIALRTIKSDIICGLAPGKFNDLPPDLMWMRTGEYAVIQLSVL